MERKIIRVITHEINDIALFEDLRFEKSSQERVIFIKKKYLENNFQNSFEKLKNSSFTIHPISLNYQLVNKYIEIFELQNEITIEEYNKLLFELIKNIKSFDEMNILIIPLLQHKAYTKELINFFIKQSLDNLTIRRSFEVQEHLLSIIVNNKKMIDDSLFRRSLVEFPHKSGGGWVESGKL